MRERVEKETHDFLTWPSLYCSLSPNESFSWRFLCPHPIAYLHVLGCLEVRPEDSRRKLAEERLLIWWYFPFWSLTLACLLLFTSQGLQIAAPCILSKFNSYIRWKIQGGVCLFHLIQNRKPRCHYRSHILCLSFTDRPGRILPVRQSHQHHVLLAYSVNILFGVSLR